MKAAGWGGTKARSGRGRPRRRLGFPGRPPERRRREAGGGGGGGGAPGGPAPPEPRPQRRPMGARDISGWEARPGRRSRRWVAAGAAPGVRPSGRRWRDGGTGR